jgi:hypothetical protein
MNKDIQNYNDQLSSEEKAVCDTLANEISANLTESESKIWHGHPVWFLNGNPIVGYSKQKKGIKLMFWSGASFDEAKLEIGTGKFKDAGIFYNSKDEIEIVVLKRWLEKSRKIQWDYKNIVKRKGVLERLI